MGKGAFLVHKANKVVHEGVTNQSDVPYHEAWAELTMTSVPERREGGDRQRPRLRTYYIERVNGKMLVSSSKGADSFLIGLVRLRGNNMPSFSHISDLVSYYRCASQRDLPCHLSSRFLNDYPIPPELTAYPHQQF